jgi:signal transduction histidine kinase
MQFNSIKFKISVLYTIILGAILIIYSAVLYFSLYNTLYEDLDNELRTKAQEITKTVNLYLTTIKYDHRSFLFAVKRVINLKEKHPDQDKIKEIERKWLKKVDKLDLTADYIVFFDSEGNVITKSSNLKGNLLFPASEEKELQEEKFRNTKFNKRNLRIINFPFTYKGEENCVIQIGTSVKPTIYILQNRLFTILMSVPIILIIIGIVSRFFVVRMLKPVEAITETAKKISHEDLSAEVKTEHPDYEMKHLVAAFNDMISRLDKSFKHIAEFSSHVAHELKTPLAIIRGESELALRKERSPEEYKRKERSPEEYKNAIKVNLEETERMVKTVDDILLLAKLDYRPEIFQFEKLNMIPFLKEIYEQSKILASSKNISVSIDMADDETNINADKVHLRRLFFNIIHNAIKFNSKDGKVYITVKSDAENVIVSVSDTGVGITEGDLPKVFNKFFHINKSEENIEPGNGLGLSIALSVAKAHHGNIKVESQFEKGSTFPFYSFFIPFYFLYSYQFLD